MNRDPNVKWAKRWDSAMTSLTELVKYDHNRARREIGRRLMKAGKALVELGVAKSISDFIRVDAGEAWIRTPEGDEFCLCLTSLYGRPWRKMVYFRLIKVREWWTGRLCAVGDRDLFGELQELEGYVSIGFIQSKLWQDHERYFEHPVIVEAVYRVNGWFHLTESSMVLRDHVGRIEEYLLGLQDWEADPMWHLTDIPTPEEIAQRSAEVRALRPRELGELAEDVSPGLFGWRDLDPIE